MADKTQITGAVLKALASNFRGMTREPIASAVGVELGVVIDGKNDLARLLPKMREAGLIRSDKGTWFITEKGKEIAVANLVSLSLFVSLLHV